MKAIAYLHDEAINLAPGQEWQDEGGSWRFLRVVKGAAYWLDTARPRALNEGELLVAGPAVTGVVRASQLSEVALQGFSFLPATICGFFTLSERHFLDSGLATVAAQIQFLPSTHPLTRRLAALTAQASQIPEMAHRAELLGLAASFFGEKMSQQPRPAPHVLSPLHRFERLIAQMPDIELIQHTPDELARLCECSPRHFHRLFRASFGQSPRAKQNELRLLKAAHLLESSDELISRIALACGYRTVSLFNALFKKRFGMNPSQWRHRAALPAQ